MQFTTALTAVFASVAALTAAAPQGPAPSPPPVFIVDYFAAGGCTPQNSFKTDGVFYYSRNQCLQIDPRFGRVVSAKASYVANGCSGECLPIPTSLPLLLVFHCPQKIGKRTFLVNNGVANSELLYRQRLHEEPDSLSKGRVCAGPWRLQVGEGYL